ncbi:hypothetical protein V6W80_18695 [Pseudomonas benzopyrenica]|uniref:Uncharacterized protein n=1 Tax=Pseudomonas benzopyrenica TaxID=2993566 RepID=A0ABZ2FLL3_9PSED
MIRRRLPLALVALALLSLILGGLAPLRWQGLPATGALLLLGLAVLEWLNARRLGTRGHPSPLAPASRARLRADTTLHLLIADMATPGQGKAGRPEDHHQALSFWRALAASGNEVRLYGLDPELRLLAAATPDRPFTPAALPELTADATADLKAALTRLCRQAQPGSVLVIMAPLDDSLVAWLARLELARRGLQLWLVDTALRQMAEPGDIRTWRDACRYAAAWQTSIESERMAARLERRGIRRLPLSETADLPVRLLQLWNAGERNQIAD